MVAALELAPVAGRAAEVRRQPGVALVDEVLRVAVPAVAGGIRRSAVRVHDGRDGAGRDGPHEEGGDLEPVEGGEADLLELRVARCAHRSGGGCVERAAGG